MRRRPDRLGLGDERGEQLLGPGLGGDLERVEPRQRPRRPLARGRSGVGLLGPAHARLQRVDLRRAGLDHPRRAQPREQVLRATARQRRASARQHAGAQPRAGQRDPPRPRHLDPVRAEHLREQRRRARPAQEHRDVLRRDPVAHQLQHLGADDLRLGALAAGLEQPHRTVGRPPLGAALEQRALEVVQRRARRRGVVLGALVQRHDLRQRRQLLHGRRAARQRVAPGLVGQRHPHIGLADARERLHRVELRARELVEAVEEHRPPAPRRRRCAQRVERCPRLALAVRAPERLEPRPVHRVERGQLVGVGRAAPRPQRAREARGLDQRTLQLREQRARRRREARRGRRRRQHAQPGIGDRGPHDAVARDRAERPRANSGYAPELPHEPVERQHLRAEHDPAGRQLALVVGDVGARRHDQEGLAVQDLSQPLEHIAGFGGVGGSGDERERHGGTRHRGAHPRRTRRTWRLVQI